MLSASKKFTKSISDWCRSGRLSLAKKSHRELLRRHQHERDTNRVLQEHLIVWMKNERHARRLETDVARSLRRAGYPMNGREWFQISPETAQRQMLESFERLRARGRVV